MISSYSACGTAHGPPIRSEARIHYDSLAQRRPIVHFSSISIKQASGRAGGCVPCYRRNCEDVMNVVNMWPPAAPHPLPHRRLDTLCCAFFGPARVRHWPGQGLRSLLSGYVDTLHCLPFCFLSSLSPCFLPSAFPLQVRLSPVIVSTKGTALSDRGLAQSVPRRTGVSDINSQFESRR